MSEQPMMMVPQQVMTQMQGDVEEDHFIPDDIIRKYSEVLQSFREGVADTVSKVDPIDWSNGESDCLHMLMSIDGRIEAALDWLEEHRRPSPDPADGTEQATLPGTERSGHYL